MRLVYQLIEVDQTFRVLVTFDEADFRRLETTTMSTLQEALRRAGGPAGELALLAMLAKEIEKGRAVRARAPMPWPALEDAVNKNREDSMAEARALKEEIREAMARNPVTKKPVTPKPKTPGSFPDLDFEEPK